MAHRSLVVPSLSFLPLEEEENRTIDYAHLSVVADMLHRSSAPLANLRIMRNHAVEEDIGRILEHCPMLLDLDLPHCYLGLPTIKKMTRGEWVPNIQALGCKIHRRLVDAFLDMLETKWEGEIGLLEADRRLMSHVRLCVNAPAEANLAPFRQFKPSLDR